MKVGAPQHKPLWFGQFLFRLLSSWLLLCPRTTTVVGFSASSIKRPPTSPSELHNDDRRKSPALWRLLHEDDDDDKIHAHGHPLEVAVPWVRRKPEIMSPAGGWAQLEAAVRNGADAVYLGLSAFSARARAVNFDIDQLHEAVRFCHARSVHVYVALNTLIFDHELAEVATLVQACTDARVDALIVQDLGLAKLVAEMVGPDVLPVHSSTQQSVTNADGVHFCHAQHRATRVVLGRELSVAEIQHTIGNVQKTASTTPSTTSAFGTDSSTGVEIEIFVHGALCVSYSGQCFSSEAWGGRSANRGQCAQACRLPYGLLVDGRLRNADFDSHLLEQRSSFDSHHHGNHVVDISYLLSPQDLCGLDQVPELLRAGVACFKIEGRLKDASYVAATTRAYRQAVDQAWADYVREYNNNKLESQFSPELEPLAKQGYWHDEDVTRTELEQLFSRGQDEVYRGLTSGFLAGTQHQNVVRGRSPRHRGVHVGRVAPGTSPRKGLVIQLDEEDGAQERLGNQQPIKLGDGLVVDRGRPQEDELGGPVYEVSALPGNRVVVQWSRDGMQQWHRHDKQQQNRSDPTSNDVWAPIGAHVWKTHDSRVSKKFAKWATQTPLPDQLVQVAVRGTKGEPLQVVITDGAMTATGSTTAVLEEAQRKDSHCDEEAREQGFRDKIRKAIGTLGNTEFAVDAAIDFSNLEPGLWCPISRVKQARRDALFNFELMISESAISETETTDTRHELTSEIARDFPSRLLEDRLNELESEQDMDVTCANDVQLSVLCRNYEQVDAVCSLLESDEESALNVSEIMVDFLEVEGMKDAVKRIRNCDVPLKVVVASPRILKPAEAGIWKSLLALEPDALLVRSTGLLYRMKQLGGPGKLVDVSTTEDRDDLPHLVAIPELIGDFSLNAANALTALELLHPDGGGLQRVTTSYDLNANAIANMGELLGPQLAQRLEVVLHCKMPIFHTEHCVFARFLSKGNSYLDCGHACTRHTVHLRDNNDGHDHLVLADMGCRNTVFAAQAQSGVHSLRSWRETGIRHFRLELVDESTSDVQMLVQTYSKALKNEIKANQAWEILNRCRDSNGRMAGVTLGSFKNTKERRAGELSTDF